MERVYSAASNQGFGLATHSTWGFRDIEVRCDVLVYVVCVAGCRMFSRLWFRLTEGSGCVLCGE